MDDAKGHLDKGSLNTRWCGAGRRRKRWSAIYTTLVSGFPAGSFYQNGKTRFFHAGLVESGHADENPRSIRGLSNPGITRIS